MREAGHPKSPGLSKTCFSGSEPVSASILAPSVDLENPWGLFEQLFSRPPSPVSHGLSCIAHGPSSTVRSQRSHVPTRRLPTINRRQLILEKKKIQITIEEQMLKPPCLCLSPVPRLRSPVIHRITIINGPQSEIINHQSTLPSPVLGQPSSTAHRQVSRQSPSKKPSFILPIFPSVFVPRKRKFKYQFKTNA